MVSLYSAPVYAQHANYAHYASAAVEFDSLVKLSKQTGEMPRISSPKAAELIAILSDRQRFLDSTKYTMANLDDLMNLCSTANAVVMSYVLFDVKNLVNQDSQPNKSTETNEGVLKVIKANAVDFHEELTALQPFLLHCVAQQIPLMNQFIENLSPEGLTNIRRSGLTSTRENIFTTYFGFLQMAQGAEPGIRYRSVLLNTLAATAQAFASGFRPLDRRKILDLVDEIGDARTPGARHWGEEIKSAMFKPFCIGLCRF
ncbi:MAG: hypothetical protein WA888_21030 [Burkholderiaceae bacterium]